MSTVSALTIPFNEVPQCHQSLRRRRTVTEHKVDMDKIHQHHHQKQEEVNQIPQERKATVSTSVLQPCPI